MKAQCYQESLLDPHAVSPVGAQGLCQFMPGTWAEVTRKLRMFGASPFHPDVNIRAAAYYMATQKRIWYMDRPDVERLKLAQASYNAGAGNIIRAQRLCDGARYWDQIKACLPGVTGHNANETITYVDRIRRWRIHLAEH